MTTLATSFMSPLLGKLTLIQSLTSYLSGTESLILVIIGFGFLIFIHELGHFLVAKWCGVRCPQFAIGFGTPIIAYRPGMGFRLGGTEAEYEKRARESLKKQGVDTDELEPKNFYEEADKLGLGETEYRLNWVPLGGYVKMVGQEDMDPAAASNDPRSFTRQAIWKRAAILSAGVVMNLIFGMIFLIVAFMIGVEFPPAIIGGVAPATPAATAYAQGHKKEAKYQGLQVGDQIVSIDGKPVRDFQDIHIATALDSRNTPIRFGVKRDDQTLHYTITPEFNKNAGMPTIGVMPPASLNVEAVGKDSPLAKQGLTPGTTLSKLNGKPVTSYAQFYRTLIDAEGKPLPATFVPNPKAIAKAQDKSKIANKPVHVMLSATPTLTSNDDNPANLLGMVPAHTVQSTKKDSPAEKAGIKSGDIIARAGMFDWPDMNQISQAIKHSPKQGVDIAVWRDGKLIDLGKIKPNSDKHIGVIIPPAIESNRVSITLPGSPAAAAHLAKGSTILAINGTKVHNWSDMQRVLVHLKASSDKTAHVSITYRVNITSLPIETRTLTLSHDEIKQLASAQWFPPPPTNLGFGMLREKVGSSNPIKAALLGFKKTKQFMIQTYISLLRLLQTTVSVKQLRGPVGIVQLGTSATQHGWSYLLFFLGIISINLAVLNFLPLPIVDGGHIVFLIIEKIKGSPVSAQIQVASMIVGLVLIGGVMLMATYNDIARLVTG